MSLLDYLSQPECWERFYEYKTSLACPKAFAAELRAFIDERAYLPVCEEYRAGARFPLPRRAVISKMSSQKKRVVYMYPKEETAVLKIQILHVPEEDVKQGTNFNVVVVYESTPVLYDEDGNPYADWTSCSITCLLN